MMTAAALCLLALVDGAFSGFRAFAGRDGRIEKRPAKIEAARLGAMGAVAALVLLAIVMLGGMALDIFSFAELEEAGRRMLVVYATFATAITIGFAAYFSPALEVRSVGTVLVLGPGTFIRPLVILGGALYGAAGSGTSLLLAALFAAMVMLGLETVLSRKYARELAAHPF